jgi:hypothetical protein
VANEVKEEDEEEVAQEADVVQESVIEDLRQRKRDLSLLLKTPSEGSLEASSPSSTGSTNIPVSFRGKQQGPGDRFSDDSSNTSSVLEFEKLEMQCSAESFEDKNEEEISCGAVSSLLDDEEFYDEEASLIRKGNFEICHDLNTIYESGDEKEKADSVTNLNEMKASSLVSQSSSNLGSPSEPTNLTANANLTKSLSKISTHELSRSSSSCSVKSNDSFENELKCSVKIDESSFFAKKLKKQNSPPQALSPLARPTTSAEPPKTSTSPTSETDSKSPSSSDLLNPTDSGQGSLSASQLQSPLSNPDDATVGMCLIANHPIISKKSIDEKFVSDLKKSMAKGTNKTMKMHSSASNMSLPSSRQSRTSSSASNASSTSLNEAIRSTIVHIMPQKTSNNKPSSFAENLPSFRLANSSSTNSPVDSSAMPKVTSNLVTSHSFNTTTDTSRNKDNNSNNNNDNSAKRRVNTLSSPNISAQHSANCYCHAHKSQSNSNMQYTNDLKGIVLDYQLVTN